MAWNPLLVISEWPFTYRLIIKSAPLIEALEKMLRRATKGKRGVLDIVGIPTIRLFIPGRRTGIVRATTLQCIRGGDGLFVVGSNWARRSHPAWTANLQPLKSVRARCQQVEYETSVREVEGPERQEAWTSILRTWPNYELAQRMAADRPFRIFTLTGPPHPPTEP